MSVYNIHKRERNIEVKRGIEEYRDKNKKIVRERETERKQERGYIKILTLSSTLAY